MQPLPDTPLTGALKMYRPTDYLMPAESCRTPVVSIVLLGVVPFVESEFVPGVAEDGSVCSGPVCG